MIQSTKTPLLCVCMAVLACLVFSGLASATPPAGDPNQAYDRLPVTWETYHVKWAKPLAGGTLKVLFIVSYSNSREVVELAQRLDVKYTVIMTAGRSVWKKGAIEGEDTASALHGSEADVLDKLAAKRLSLKNKYDAIVIGKISWEVIPKELRELILKHVNRGAGLVYVSPNRFKPGRGSNKEVEASDPEYQSLFQTNIDPKVGKNILASMPTDIMPLKVLNSLGDFASLGKPLPDYRPGGRFVFQSPVCITATNHGKGRVISLNYFDDKLSKYPSDDSLTPRVEYDRETYDLLQALLARCVRWSAGRDISVAASIDIRGPKTDLTQPVDKANAKFSYEFKTPKRVLARKDLPKAKIDFSAKTDDGRAGDVTLDYAIRDLAGAVIASGKVSSDKTSIPIPTLQRGNYVASLRVLDRNGKVLDFAMRSFRVEAPLRVTSVTTERETFARRDTITGKAKFSAAISPKQNAEVRVVDTWGRTVLKQPVSLNPERTGGTFSVPVDNPVSNLWDICVVIRDKAGDIDLAKTWVGIPQTEFDEYYWGIIFTAAPGASWKGCMYADRGREFGINGNFSRLIFGDFPQLEAVERRNMQNLMFTEHFGQTISTKAHRGPWDKELSEACMAQYSKMLRYTARTGKLPNSKLFPYVYKVGWWSAGADWLAGKMKEYKKAAKYGTPFHTLTGENYLSGEMPGVDSPNSCFCELCTKNFQTWCKEQYKNDLKALNAEWGTDFKSWDQIRGILRPEAVAKGQQPRWVAFRHFMRSAVWSQLFVDWTDALRVFLPGAKTGRVGHDHFDFSRFRNHMTSSKIYNLQQDNDELDVMVPQELLQSFSGDKSWLIGASSIMRWMPDHRTPRRQERLPWKMMFMGFRGFDWERNLKNEALGGGSSFTPDFSEPLPFFKTISDQVLFLQRGIGKLANTAKPLRSPVAIMYSSWNDYISRLSRPGGKNMHAPSKEKYPFSGSWLYNTSADFGALHDSLALLKALRIRGTFVAPRDVINGDLEKRGFKVLMLPYSKGMSTEEADAIRKFAKGGGLVIGDNTPGIYSRFGRKLDKPRLADMFPVTDKLKTVRVGKGYAVYAPEMICGHLKRMVNCDRGGSDEVAKLLKKYAGVTTPIELFSKGKPRRDTLMPIYVKGSAMYVGMMRHEKSDGKTEAPTVMRLGEKRHIWDVRERKYLGYKKSARINLDMYPKFFALLPANPTKMTLQPEQNKVAQGKAIRIGGHIDFKGGDAEKIAEMGQAVHVRVYAPDGKELECFRDNIIFDGPDFEITLPISYSESAGKYTVKAEYAATGMNAQTSFEIVQK